MLRKSKDERLFDRTFRGRGGLWGDGVSGTMGSQFLHLCRTLAPDIYVNFINDRSFNAVAALANRRELIGINIGSFELVHNCFFNLLSRRDCLHEIGDGNAESSEILPTDFENPTVRRPNDPVRAKAAIDLAFCALVILYMHERSHIELCHIAFLKEQFGVAEYCEMQIASQLGTRPWLCRTLEKDADVSGAVTSARFWKCWYNSVNLTHLEPLGWARSWIIAAQMLFWIMELVHPPRNDQVVLGHSAPHFRLVSVMDAVSKYAEIPSALTEQELQHDKLIPWIATQCSALQRPFLMITDDAIAQQTHSLNATYRSIADRLEELQDARAKQKGTTIDRPGYPGSGWARPFKEIWK